MTIRHGVATVGRYGDIGSWSLGPVWIRRLLNLISGATVVAAFAQIGEPDVLLDFLWVLLAVGAFVFGLRQTVLRIALVLGVVFAYTNAADAGLVRPIELELFDLTEWPLLLVFAMVVAVMAERVGSAARRYAALYREASDRLVTAHEDERRQLARDLHDGVGQTLTGVILSLDAADEASEDPGALRATVRHARELAVTALEQARDVAGRLRPPRIEEIGLGAAVTDLAKSAGRPVDVRLDPGAIPPGLLDPDREINAYRVVQEALCNASRYAAAAHVWIDGGLAAGVVTLEVGDDGIGFEPSRVSEGLGLPGMEERARLLDGELSITSKRGAGTTVELSFPADPRQAEPKTRRRGPAAR